MSRSRIERLSTADIAHIRSSVVITSLQDVVLGLVKNSLDAGATSIEVHVNFSRGSCEVKDNGCGIAMNDFAEDGALLQQYSTSKRDAINLHGCNGTFLTSVGSLALLAISSTQENELDPSSMTMHHSKIISRTLPSPENSSRQLGEQGTVITVRELFGNMPVRVKQRALQEDSNGMARVWMCLNHDLLALLVAWPDQVSLELFDEHTDRKLSVRRKTPVNSVMTSRGSLAPAVYHVLNILTQANILEPTSWPSWVPVSASTSSIRVKGVISLDPVATKRHQFISFGVAPLQTEESSNELFAEINRVFANSRFGTVDDAVLDDATSKQRSMDRRFKQEGFTDKQLQGGRKGIDRWPMFCFKVSFKQTQNVRSLRSLGPDQEPLIARIIDLIGTMVTQWLVEHHFRPMKWRTRTESMNLQRLRPTTPLSGATVRAMAPAVTPAPCPHTPSKRPLSGHTAENTPVFTATAANTDSPHLTWVHPMTKQKHLIDKQSGAVCLVEDPRESNSNTVTGSERPLVPPKKSIRLEAKAAPADDRPQSAWVQNVLDTWNNPVFVKCGHTIPRVNSEDPKDGTYTSISNLDRAEVISQLDTKFILIKVSGGVNGTAAAKSNLLVIVDQHAADERIKVEGLLRDLCARFSLVKLQTPLCFKVSAPEAKSMRALRDHFFRWGITYDLAPDSAVVPHHGSSAPYVQLEVAILPAGIAERCTREPLLLIEMLRSEALDYSENHRKILAIPPESRDNAYDGHSWLRQITACPLGLLDMLNSRACRSAIMFNDHLDARQCKDLISRLSKCALPFQCAHGRPSMVPIVDIGHACPPAGTLGMFDEYKSGASDTGQISFAAAFQSWRARSQLN